MTSGVSLVGGGGVDGDWLWRRRPGVIGSRDWPGDDTQGRRETAVAAATFILRRIRMAPPERVIPFGSAVRGEMVDDGDLDVLVVADMRPSDTWYTGSARRGGGGAGLVTSLSRRQRWSKPTRTTRAATSTMRCAKVGFSAT